MRVFFSLQLFPKQRKEKPQSTHLQARELAAVERERARDKLPRALELARQRLEERRAAALQIRGELCKRREGGPGPVDGHAGLGVLLFIEWKGKKR